MDRWYGPKGLRPEGPENAVYVFTGAPGMKPLSEIAPTEQEVSDGWFNTESTWICSGTSMKTATWSR